MKKCFLVLKLFLKKTVYPRIRVTKNRKEQKNAFFHSRVQKNHKRSKIKRIKNSFSFLVSMHVTTKILTTIAKFEKRPNNDRKCFNRYRRVCTKMDATIFDSALSHTRRSDASEKKEENTRVHFGANLPGNNFRFLACID